MYRYLFPLLALLMLSACAPTRVFMKTYEGTPPPTAQTALLKPFLGIQITSIDGDYKKNIAPLRPGNPTNLDIDISFLPGPHTITVGYYIIKPQATVYSTVDKLVKFDAVAGRRYILKGIESGMNWEAVIEDVTDQPAKWCWSEWQCGFGPSSPMPPEKIR